MQLLPPMAKRNWWMTMTSIGLNSQCLLTFLHVIPESAAVRSSVRTGKKRDAGSTRVGIP